METDELEIDMDNDLIVKTRDLAIRYFGDDTDASLALIIEIAFKMRRLWSSSIKRDPDETEEAVSQWEFPQLPATHNNEGNVNKWLFRR